MNIKINDNDERVVLELKGKLDKYTSPALENEILKILPNLQNRMLEIDMSNVTYLSSAGLRVLLTTHKEINGKMVVTHVKDEIKEIFKITGFTKVLTIE